AVFDETAMAPWANTDILAIAPIDEIVLALRARSCMVRHFVSRKPLRGRNRLRRFIEIGGMIRIGDRDLAGAIEAVEGGPFLNGQLVERKVIGSVADCLLQLIGPGFDGLAGAGVDQ